MEGRQALAGPGANPPGPHTTRLSRQRLDGHVAGTDASQPFQGGLQLLQTLTGGETRQVQRGARRAAAGKAHLQPLRHRVAGGEPQVEHSHLGGHQCRDGPARQGSLELHAPEPRHGACRRHPLHRAAAGAQQAVELPLQTRRRQACRGEWGGAAEGEACLQSGPAEHHLTAGRCRQGEALAAIAAGAHLQLAQLGHGCRFQAHPGGQARETAQGAAAAERDLVVAAIGCRGHGDAQARAVQAGSGAAVGVLQGGGRHGRLHGGRIGGERDRCGFEVARTAAGPGGAQGQRRRRRQARGEAEAQGRHRLAQGSAGEGDAPLVGGRVQGHAHGAAGAVKTAAAAGGGGQQGLLQAAGAGLQVHGCCGVSAAGKAEAELQAAAGIGGEAPEAMDGSGGGCSRLAAAGQDWIERVGDAGGNAAVAGQQGPQGPHLIGDGIGEADAIELAVRGGHQLLHRDGVGAHGLHHGTAGVGPGGGRPGGHQAGQGLEHLPGLGVLGVGEHGAGAAVARLEAEGDAVAVVAGTTGHRDREGVRTGHLAGGRASLGLQLGYPRGGQGCGWIRRRHQQQALLAGLSGQGNGLAGEAIHEPQHEPCRATAVHLHIGASEQLLQGALQASGKDRITDGGPRQIEAVGGGLPTAVVEGPAPFTEAAAVAAGTGEQQFGVGAALHVEADPVAAHHAACEGGQLHGATVPGAAGHHHRHLPQAAAHRLCRRLHVQISQGFSQQAAAELQPVALGTVALHHHGVRAVETLEAEAQSCGQIAVTAGLAAVREGGHRDALATAAAEPIAAFPEAAAVGVGCRQQPGARRGITTAGTDRGRQVAGAERCP